RVTKRNGKEWQQRLCSGWSNTCKALAMKGKTKCKNCGGKTPSGAASPHFKTGEHSKEFLTRFRQRSEQFLNDRDGRELARAIAYSTTLVEEAIDKLDS